MRPHIFLIILTLLLTFLSLNGCQTKPSGQNQTFDSENLPQDEAERELWLAQKATADERVNHLLKALDIFIGREDHESSQQVINRLQASSMSTRQYEQFALLAGAFAIKSNDPITASSYFKNAPLDAFSTAPLEIQLEANELRCDALLAANFPLEAARIRVYNSGLYTGEDYWHNQDKTWQALRATPSLDLNNAIDQAVDLTWRGWLELVTQIRLNQFSLEMQLNALQQWRETWPDHPAAIQLPRELEMLSNLSELSPKKIALILPLSGKLAKAGNAIRDGFLAAYYQDHQRDSDTEITFFDSEAYESPLDLYLQLQLENYELIIGPLTKEGVKQLGQFPELTPPVLALNYLDDQISTIPGLYQFGLSAEDELNQILNHLKSQKKSTIAVIHNQSASAKKLVATINKRSEMDGWPITINYGFTSDQNLSEGVANLLGIQESKSRTNQLRRLIGKVDSEPRRRQDIDAVIILASPIKARQIKPLLAFHYASNIPVYATSQIYSGYDQPKKDHDLNGVVFTEIPWLLNQSEPLRQDIHYLTQKTAYERFYAMGADAYLLAPRLQLLASFPTSKVQGVTGNLVLNHNLQVRRQLEWATFSKGQAKAQLGH